MNSERATLLAMTAPRLVAGQVESLGVNGLALARGANAIGFRAIPLLPPVGRFDGKLVISTLQEIGPHDPADQYHHLAFQVPITRAAIHRWLRLELIMANSMLVPDFQPGETATVHLEWTFDEAVAQARVSSDQPLDLVLLMNGCLKPAAVRSVAATEAALEQDGWRIVCQLAGDLAAHCQESDVERLDARLRGLPVVPSDVAPCVTGHRFRLAPDRPVYVALAEQTVAVDPRRVDETLVAGRAAMPARLMSSGGAAAHCADAIQRLVGYSACYDPVSRLRHLPVNRDWVGPNSPGVEALWDNFFDSYLGCLHHPALGQESLRQVLYLLETRGVTGAPPQRNLIVPIIYSKLVRFVGDREFAAATLPTMLTLLRFYFGDRGDGHPWRDGNDDGLIECGSCLRPGETPLGRIIQNAFDETGYDDSPMYSAGFAYEWRGLLAEGVEFDFDRGTLNLTMVGQNALYVAACRAVAVVASWVGAREDATWLLAEADRVAARIHERLFDPAVGYYRNRFFNGRFSPVKTPDLFFPLLAGLGDESVRQRLCQILLDPRQFWGDNVIPTVSRDDPAYGDEPVRATYWRGNYWRGNVWPPTNYITYLALRGAGCDHAAAAVSAASRRLFLDDWLPRHHAHENYPPTGRNDRTQMFAGFGGRDPHYVWAALLPLISLEELFAVEDTRAGLRFGTLEPSSWGAWEGFIYHGQRGRCRCEQGGLSLDIPGLLQVSADRPVAIRDFLHEGTTVHFRYSAATAVKLQVVRAGQTTSFNLPPAAGQMA